MLPESFDFNFSEIFNFNFTMDDNLIVMAVLAGIAAIGIVFAAFCIAYKPKRKPWWMI